MTYAPITLQNLRSYLVGMGAPVLGIVGNPATHKRGYHIGSPLLPGDYSGIQPRDKAGLSAAASAIDIGRFNRLIELLTYLRTESQEGRLRDVREIIAERDDGTHIWRWDAVTGKATGKPDSQELPHHGHVSYYRDSQSRTKLPPYQRFFTPLEDEMVYSIKGVDGPFPATVMAPTPYYPTADSQQATGTLTDDSRPFTVVCESKDGARRCIYGRTSPSADRAVLGWVASDRIVR